MSRVTMNQFWNTTAAERAARYPAHAYARAPYATHLRAVDVAADSDTVFRWLCQLTVAPYSYDWADNLGRQSPRTLTPGAHQLREGQLFLIARIVEFETGRHITGVSTKGSDRVFGGPIVLTYQVTPTGPHTSRLLVCMTVTARHPLARVRRYLLSWGDLVMMRRQLLNLKRLAERTPASESRTW